MIENRYMIRQVFISKKKNKQKKPVLTKLILLNYIKFIYSIFFLLSISIYFLLQIVCNISLKNELFLKHYLKR